MQHKFCTYLLIYRGNKLPPFYIGSGTIYKIKNEGYIGSVSSKQYRKFFEYEKKHNRELFAIKILKTFNTRKQAYSSEERLHKHLAVVKNPLYMNLGIANSKHNRGDMSKPIVQLTLFGGFVREFKSITSCEKITGLKQGNINACLHKHTKQAFGYLWVYKSEYDKDCSYKLGDNRRNKTYVQYDKDGVFVKEWTGMKKITDTLKVNSIQLFSHETPVMSRGYFWFIKNDFGKYLDLFNAALSHYKKNYIVKSYKHCKITSLALAKDKKQFTQMVSHRLYIRGRMIFTLEEWDKDKKGCEEEYYYKHKDYLDSHRKHKKVTYDKTPIVQLTKEGKYIATFYGVKDVSQNTSIHQDSIRSCLLKKYKQAGGYQFFYEDEYLRNKHIGKNIQFEPAFKYLILQVDKNTGCILKTFKNANHVRECFGNGDVNAVLRGKQKTSNGSLWYEIKCVDNIFIGSNIKELKDFILRPKIKQI